VLGAALAQARLGVGIAAGRSVPRWAQRRLARAAVRTFEQYGALGGGAAGGIEADEGFARRAFAKAARAAGRESEFWAERLPAMGRRALTPEQVGVLSRDEFAGAGEALVSRGAQAVFCAQSSGTTGRRVRTWFSQSELDLYATLSVLGHLRAGTVHPGDEVLICQPEDGLAANVTAAAATQIGARPAIVGCPDPARLLARLIARPGPFVLSASASYLAALCAAAGANGLAPELLSVRSVLSGGEILSARVRNEAGRLFGAPVHESLGMSETYPVSGPVCPEGHLHFDPLSGLVEVLALDDERPAKPGELGRLIVTPFPPFRQTTPLLRYDTEDIVRTLDQPPSCQFAHMPAVSAPLGKRRLAIRHAHGTTWPRELIEAVESVPGMPLPARFSARPNRHGIAIDVVWPAAGAREHGETERTLAQHHLPISELRLTATPGELRNPYPLRYRGPVAGMRWPTESERAA
jgi:AMP-binding enzyme